MKKAAYSVVAFRDWSDGTGVRVGFSDQDDAANFAAALAPADFPLIDLVSHRPDNRILAQRRALAFPDARGIFPPFVSIDDFPAGTPTPINAAFAARLSKGATK